MRARTHDIEGVNCALVNYSIDRRYRRHAGRAAALPNFDFTSGAGAGKFTSLGHAPNSTRKDPHADTKRPRSACGSGCRRCDTVWSRRQAELFQYRSASIAESFPITVSVNCVLDGQGWTPEGGQSDARLCHVAITPVLMARRRTGPGVRSSRRRTLLLPPRCLPVDTTERPDVADRLLSLRGPRLARHTSVAPRPKHSL